MKLLMKFVLILSLFVTFFLPNSLKSKALFVDPGFEVISNGLYSKSSPDFALSAGDYHYFAGGNTSLLYNGTPGDAGTCLTKVDLSTNVSTPVSMPFDTIINCGAVTDSIKDNSGNTYFALGTLPNKMTFTTGGNTYYALIKQNSSGDFVTNFHPFDFQAVIYSMLVDGNYLYVTGEFARLSPSPTLSRLVRINLTTGLIDETWTPNPHATSGFLALYSLAKDSTYLYVAGKFNDLDGSGSTHTNLGRYNLSTGELDLTWHPTINNVVKSIKVSGLYLYLVGDFTSVSSTSRKYIARITLSTGNLDASWDPGTTYLTEFAQVATISTTTDAVFIGGNSFDYPNVKCSSVMKFMVSDGSKDVDWCNNSIVSNGTTVSKIFTDNDNVYPSGNFYVVNGKTRLLGFAQLDIDTGELGGVEPSVYQSQSCGSSLNTQCTKSGNELYVTGVKLYDTHPYEAGNIFREDSEGVIDTSFKHYTKLDTLGVLGEVNVFKTDNSQYLYIGGSFDHVDDYPLEYIARINYNTGLVDDSFDLNIVKTGGYAYVNDVYIDGDTLYISGKFDSVLGETRKGFAAINLTDKTLLPWTANVGSTGNQYGFNVLKNGNDIYVAGSFDHINGVSVANIAKTSSLDSTVTVLGVETDSDVTTLVKHEEYIYFGGYYSEINGVSTGNSAFHRFVISTGDYDPTFDPFDGDNAYPDRSYTLGLDLTLDGYFTIDGTDYTGVVYDLESQEFRPISDQFFYDSFDNNLIGMDSGALYRGRFSSAEFGYSSQIIPLKYQIKVPDGFVALDSEGNEITLGADNGEFGDNVEVQLDNGIDIYAEVETQLSQDLDWSVITSETDLVNNKTFSSGIEDVPGAMTPYSILLPKADDDNGVIVCPDVSSLSAVITSCEDKATILEDQTEDVVFESGTREVTLHKVTLDSRDYWKIEGSTDAGVLGTYITPPVSDDDDNENTSSGGSTTTDTNSDIGTDVDDDGEDTNVEEETPIGGNDVGVPTNNEGQTGKDDGSESQGKHSNYLLPILGGISGIGLIWFIFVKRKKDSEG